MTLQYSALKNRMQNKRNYSKQLKEQMKAKYYQQLLQKSIDHELRKEIDIKNRYMEDQQRHIRKNKEEAQRLYKECLENQEK